MVKQRMPQSVVDSRELNDDEKKFVGKVERDNYSALDEHQLVNEYLSVDQQSQLLKGKILLEIRKRIPNNVEFGNFIEENLGTICSDTRQSRTRFMNLAKFFETRELDKISISAAYEISAPVNSDIAVEIYEIARGKNMPLAEVRRQIALKKGVSGTSVVPTSNDAGIQITAMAKTDEEIVQKAVEIMDESIKNETVKIETDLKSQLMALAQTVSP
ncbi:MAG: hypothetical protein WBI40_06740, partial [Methylococcaceae bacterium]